MVQAAWWVPAGDKFQRREVELRRQQVSESSRGGLPRREPASVRGETDRRKGKKGLGRKSKQEKKGRDTGGSPAERDGTGGKRGTGHFPWRPKVQLGREKTPVNRGEER